MNGPEDFDRPAEPLPQWQADRLATLLDSLGGISVGARERASLVWLSGFESSTVENIAAVMRRLTRRTELLDRKLTAAIDDARARHLEADRYRRQLADLCDWAGLDPEDVDDPYAALLAHLRARESRGVRRERTGLPEHRRAARVDGRRSVR